MAALFAASACFGVMAVLVRAVAAEFGPLEVAWIRFAGSLVLLAPLGRGRGRRPRRAGAGALLLRGLLGAVSIVCYFAGIARAGAGLATLLHSIYPVFTALWGVVVLGRAVTGRLGAALVLSAGGAAVVVHDQVERGPEVLGGALLALLGGILAGGAVLTASELRRRESASRITVWFMAVGAVVTAPAALDGLPSPTVQSGLLLAGIVATSATGQWLLHHGLGFVPATVGSLAVATSVATATLLEALLFGSGVGAAPLAGGAMMLAAVALALGGEGADVAAAGRSG